MNENPNQPARQPQTGTASGSAKFNSPLFIWPAAVVLAVLLFFGLGLFFRFADARIHRRRVHRRPRCFHRAANRRAGRRRSRFGQPDWSARTICSWRLIRRITPSPSRKKQAAAASQDANFRTIVAAYELMRAKVTTAEASARKAKADADAAEATAKKAQSDFERAQDLLKQKTISQQEFDAALAANTKAQADLKSAQENADEETSKVDEARQAACRRVCGKGHGVFAIQRIADQRRRRRN